MSDLAVIILAAGKGTRMKSETPKVLHKVAGKSLLWHVLATAKKLEPVKTIVVVAPNMPDVEAEAAGTEIALQEQQLGTGDAVKAGLSKLAGFEGNVVILYGDCPLIEAESLKRLIASHRPGNISMFGFFANDPTGYGRLITRRNLVGEIVEQRDCNPYQQRIRLCNSGIYVLEVTLLASLLEKVQANNSQKEYYLTDIVKLNSTGQGKTFYQTLPEEEVMGVNTKLDLAAVELVMQNRLRDAALLGGVTMIAPETVYLSTDTIFGKNVTLLPNVVIGENVVIGDDIKIGPFAHIRAGTVLKNNSHIGNFVELKKSVIGENSKVSHLSYIGDSVLGADVNIGAGTITCNYDGINKSQTTIEDGVFIGSNTALVAPVTIAKGAIIGAGSTITKNVEADSLAVTRAEQKTLPGWAAEFRNKNKK